jgi:hypothetical protein
VSQLPKWSYLQWADDVAQMQSSFPNLGYFHLWCLLWAGIIRIAVRVGRRQRLYRFLSAQLIWNRQLICLCKKTWAQERVIRIKTSVV